MYFLNQYIHLFIRICSHIILYNQKDHANLETIVINTKPDNAHFYTITVNSVEEEEIWEVVSEVVASEGIWDLAWEEKEGEVWEVEREDMEDMEAKEEEENFFLNKTQQYLFP